MGRDDGADGSRRAVLNPRLLLIWGLRGDNFWEALRLQSFFAIPAVIFLVVLGLINGTVPLPRSFWVVAALYPLFRIAQQFVLQNLIVRNLTNVITHPFALAFVSALLFSLAHLPRLSLTALALILGFFLTVMYIRRPNLWAVGIVHGILAPLAF